MKFIRILLVTVGICVHVFAVQAAVVRRENAVYCDSVSVIVDYNRSIEASVAAGKYDFVCKGIDDTNFVRTDSGVRTLSLMLMWFDTSMTSTQVLEELDQQGMRPATLQELLSLGEQHPHLQLNNCLVALGTVWRAPWGLSVPSLARSYYDWRCLDLGEFHQLHPATFRFVSVRKS